MKHKQPCPDFNLCLLCPFVMIISIMLRGLPHLPTCLSISISGFHCRHSKNFVLFFTFFFSSHLSLFSTSSFSFFFFFFFFFFNLIFKQYFQLPLYNHFTEMICQFFYQHFLITTFLFNVTLPFLFFLWKCDVSYFCSWLICPAIFYFHKIFLYLYYFVLKFFLFTVFWHCPQS